MLFLLTLAYHLFLSPLACSLQFVCFASNAIKFTDKGKKIEVSVTRKASASGQELVLIACKDQGAGLSKANLKLLFGEGVQFHANKLQAGGGSGLGLFITKGIVALHMGANIWAESEGEGKGCTFFVELPLVTISPSFDCEADNDEDKNSVPSPRADEKHDETSPQASNCIVVPVALSGALSLKPFKPRVLIVDDSLMNRRMLSRMLEAEGFECLQAVDGLAALAVVNRALLIRGRFSLPPVSSLKVRNTAADKLNLFAGKPLEGDAGRGEDASLRSNGSADSTFCGMKTDVILMDSNMPKMNGPDAIVEIRKLGFTFPILGVTGDQDHGSFMRAGADGVMMKPVRAAELVKAIRTALRNAVDCAPKANAERQATEQQLEADGLLAPRRISAFRVRVMDDEHLANLEGWLKGPPTAPSR